MVARISGIDKGCNSASLGNSMHGTCIGFRLGGLTHLAMHLVTLLPPFSPRTFTPHLVTPFSHNYTTNSPMPSVLYSLKPALAVIPHASSFKTTTCLPIQPHAVHYLFQNLNHHHYTHLDLIFYIC